MVSLMQPKRRKVKYSCDEALQAVDVRFFERVGTKVWAGERTGAIAVRNAETGAVEQRLAFTHARQQDFVWCLLALGKRVWAGYSSGAIRIYHAETAELLKEVMAHKGGVSDLVSFDQRIYSASSDCTVGVWHLSTSTLGALYKGHSGAIRCLCCHSDLLFSGSDDASVRAWTTSGTTKAVMNNHKGPVLALTVNGGFLWAAAEEWTITIWDVASFKKVKVIDQHKAKVNSLISVKDTVWSASHDRSICVWDAQGFQLIKRFSSQDGLDGSAGFLRGVLHREVWTVWASVGQKSLVVLKAERSLQRDSDIGLHEDCNPIASLGAVLCNGARPRDPILFDMEDEEEFLKRQKLRTPLQTISNSQEQEPQKEEQLYVFTDPSCPSSYPSEPGILTSLRPSHDKTPPKPPAEGALAAEAVTSALLSCVSEGVMHVIPEKYKMSNGKVDLEGLRRMCQDDVRQMGKEGNYLKCITALFAWVKDMQRRQSEDSVDSLVLSSDRSFRNSLPAEEHSECEERINTLQAMLDAERKLAEERLVQLTGAQAEVQAVHQKHAEMETSLQQARAEVLQMRTSRDHYQDSRDQAAAQIVQLRKQSAELEEELRTIQEAMRGMTAQLDQQDRTGDAGSERKEEPSNPGPQMTELLQELEATSSALEARDQALEAREQEVRQLREELDQSNRDLQTALQRHSRTEAASSSKAGVGPSSASGAPAVGKKFRTKRLKGHAEGKESKRTQMQAMQALQDDAERLRLLEGLLQAKEEQLEVLQEVGEARQQQLDELKTVKAQALKTLMDAVVLPGPQRGQRDPAADALDGRRVGSATAPLLAPEVPVGVGNNAEVVLVQQRALELVFAELVRYSASTVSMSPDTKQVCDEMDGLLTRLKEAVEAAPERWSPPTQRHRGIQVDACDGPAPEPKGQRAPSPVVRARAMLDNRERRALEQDLEDVTGKRRELEETLKVSRERIEDLEQLVAARGDLLREKNEEIALLKQARQVHLRARTTPPTSARGIRSSSPFLAEESSLYTSPRGAVMPPPRRTSGAPLSLTGLRRTSNGGGLSLRGGSEDAVARAADAGLCDNPRPAPADSERDEDLASALAAGLYNLTPRSLELATPRDHSRTAGDDPSTALTSPSRDPEDAEALEAALVAELQECMGQRGLLARALQTLYAEREEFSAVLSHSEEERKLLSAQVEGLNEALVLLKTQVEEFQLRRMTPTPAPEPEAAPSDGAVQALGLVKERLQALVEPALGGPCPASWSEDLAAAAVAAAALAAAASSACGVPPPRAPRVHIPSLHFPASLQHSSWYGAGQPQDSPTSRASTRSSSSSSATGSPTTLAAETEDWGPEAAGLKEVLRLLQVLEEQWAPAGPMALQCAAGRALMESLVEDCETQAREALVELEDAQHRALAAMIEGVQAEDGRGDLATEPETQTGDAEVQCDCPVGVDTGVQCEGVPMLNAHAQCGGVAVDTATQADGVACADSGIQVDGMPVVDTETQVDGVVLVDSDTQVDAVVVVDTETQFDKVGVVDSVVQVDRVVSVHAETQFENVGNVNTETQVDTVPVVDTETQADSVAVVDSFTQVDGVVVVDSETQFDSVPFVDTETQCEGVPMADLETQVDTVTVADTETQCARVEVAQRETQCEGVAVTDTEAQCETTITADTEAQCDRVALRNVCVETEEELLGPSSIEALQEQLSKALREASETQSKALEDNQTAYHSLHQELLAVQAAHRKAQVCADARSAELTALHARLARLARAPCFRDRHPATHEEWDVRVKQAHRALDGLVSELAKKDAVIAKKDTELRRAFAQLEKGAEAQAGLVQALAARDQQFAQHEEAAAARDAELQERAAEVQQKALRLAALQEECADLRQIHAAAQGREAELDAHVRELEARLEPLERDRDKWVAIAETRAQDLGTALRQLASPRGASAASDRASPASDRASANLVSSISSQTDPTSEVSPLTVPSSPSLSSQLHFPAGLSPTPSRSAVSVQTPSPLLSTTSVQTANAVVLFGELGLDASGATPVRAPSPEGHVGGTHLQWPTSPALLPDIGDIGGLMETEAEASRQMVYERDSARQEAEVLRLQLEELQAQYKDVVRELEKIRRKLWDQTQTYDALQTSHQGTVLELETLRLSVTERDDSTSATPSPEKDGVLQTPSPGHQDPNRTPKKAPVASASPASRRKKLRKRLQSPRISRRPWDEGQGDSTPSSGPASRLQQVLEEARKRVALQEEQAFGSQWMELEAECEQLQADREALARSHDEALERLKQREGSWMDRLRQWEQQQALSVTRHLNMGPDVSASDSNLCLPVLTNSGLSDCSDSALSASCRPPLQPRLRKWISDLPQALPNPIPPTGPFSPPAGATRRAEASASPEQALAGPSSGASQVHDQADGPAGPVRRDVLETAPVAPLEADGLTLQVPAWDATAEPPAVSSSEPSSTSPEPSPLANGPYRPAYEKYASSSTSKELRELLRARPKSGARSLGTQSCSGDSDRGISPLLASHRSAPGRVLRGAGGYRMASSSRTGSEASYSSGASFSSAPSHPLEALKGSRAVRMAIDEDISYIDELIKTHYKKKEEQQ